MTYYLLLDTLIEIQMIATGRSLTEKYCPIVIDLINLTRIEVDTVFDSESEAKKFAEAIALDTWLKNGSKPRVVTTGDFVIGENCAAVTLQGASLLNRRIRDFMDMRILTDHLVRLKSKGHSEAKLRIGESCFHGKSEIAHLPGMNLTIALTEYESI